jgi:serine/threonine protein kinase
MLDVAQGMTYLAKRKIVHRDLATRNVLVNADYICKVSDFGMSREVAGEEEEYYAANTGIIPLRWTSPEALKSRHFSTASDVWSFSVLCGEWMEGNPFFFTLKFTKMSSPGEVFDDGAQPYAKFNNTEVMVHVQAGNGLPQPKTCPQPYFADIMAPCFLERPDARPKFAHLVRKIKTFVDGSVFRVKRNTAGAGTDGSDSDLTQFTGGQTSAGTSMGESSRATDYMRPDDEPDHEGAETESATTATTHEADPVQDDIDNDPTESESLSIGAGAAAPQGVTRTDSLLHSLSAQLPVLEEHPDNHDSSSSGAEHGGVRVGKSVTETTIDEAVSQEDSSSTTV